MAATPVRDFHKAQRLMRAMKLSIFRDTARDLENKVVRGHVHSTQAARNASRKPQALDTLLSPLPATRVRALNRVDPSQVHSSPVNGNEQGQAH